MHGKTVLVDLTVAFIIRNATKYMISQSMLISDSFELIFILIFSRKIDYFTFVQSYPVASCSVSYPQAVRLEHQIETERERERAHC